MELPPNFQGGLRNSFDIGNRTNNQDVEDKFRNADENGNNNPANKALFICLCLFSSVIMGIVFYSILFKQ